MNLTDTDTKISQLIGKLKSKFSIVNIHLTANGEWYIHGAIGVEESSVYRASKPGLMESLNAALEWVPEKVIPPKPPRYTMGMMEARKDGSKWRLYHGSRYMGILTSTKKQAMDAASTIVERSNREATEWESLYCN